MENKAFEEINALSNSEWIITCEHAGAQIPPEYNSLGLSMADLDTHIARDKGAREVARLLAQKLNCYAILGKYSRLLVDLNRRSNENESIVTSSDKVMIPANQNLDEKERNKRLDLYYYPYYRALEEQISHVKSLGKKPLIFSVHSFTPQLKGGEYRPWNAGILWNKPNKLSDFVYRELSQNVNKKIGANVPYDLQKYSTGAVITCGEEKGYDYGLIEIRDSEFDNLANGAEWWATNLANILQKFSKK